MLATPGPIAPDSQIRKDKEILTAPNSKIQKGIKSLSTPDSTIQRDIQTTPAPMKPLLEVLSAPDLTIQKSAQTSSTLMKPLLEVLATPADPIILYSPLPVIQPPVTDTHAIPWVYQAPNQDN